MLMQLLRRAFLLPMCLLFATEGGGGASGANGAGAAGSSNAGGSTGGTNQDPNAGGSGGATGGASGKTYSEEEANRIATEREERARKAALKSYFEQQGYTAEEVDALLKKDKEAKEAAKTEAQKEKEKREAAELAAKNAEAKANARLAKAAFLVQAIAAGIPADRTEDAAALVAVQLAGLTPDATGEFKVEDIKKIAEDLVKAKPWLKGDNSGGGNVGGGGGNPGGGTAPKPGDIGAAMAKQAEPDKNDPWAAKRKW